MHENHRPMTPHLRVKIFLSLHYCYKKASPAYICRLISKHNVVLRYMVQNVWNLLLCVYGRVDSPKVIDFHMYCVTVGWTDSTQYH